MTECEPECTARRRAGLMKDSKTGITSESEYCQSMTSRDAAIESNIETDEVCVIAEIYSLTDIPAAMRAEVERPPRPGMIRAEIFAGKCVVLNAFRNKAVNTFEPEYVEPGPATPYKPKATQKVCRASKVAKKPKTVRDKSPPSNRMAAAFPSCLKYAQLNIRCAAPTCSSACPNLIISEPVQTDDTITASVQPTDQGDTVCVDTEFVAPPKVPKPPSSLSAIEEQEEGPEIQEVESEEELATEDMAVGSAEAILPEDRRPPVFTAELYEMGTMLTTHSSTWLDRRKIRGDCGMIFAAISSDCFYNDSRIQCIGYCARPAISHCVMPCIQQGTASTSQMSYCDPTRSCANRMSPREKEAVRYYDASAPYRNPGPNDAWSCLERVRSQPCAVDTCLQSRPSRSDACNQYYLKSKIHRYCWCSNGYVRHASHYCVNYCNTGNQTYYRPPAYCYSYSWC